MSSSEIANYSSEKQRSFDFFTSPFSYAPIEVVDGRRITDCIDPREKRSRNRIRTSVQTAGGEVGLGLDQANAMTAKNGIFINLHEGIELDSQVRVGAIGDVHHSCRFVQDMEAVLAEMAQPSERTITTYERWLGMYQLNDYVTRNITAKIMGASVQQLEFVREHGNLESVIDLVDGLFPGHQNVAHMVGENQARFWIDNHLPNMGLDRQKKHREAKLSIQSYHNSLAAAKLEIQGSAVVNSSKERDYKIASLFLRSAATRTILGGLHEDIVYLEVNPSFGPSGLEVVEVGS